jgi:hypothetical protein
MITPYKKKLDLELSKRQFFSTPIITLGPNPNPIPNSTPTPTPNPNFNPNPIYLPLIKNNDTNPIKEFHNSLIKNNKYNSKFIIFNQFIYENIHEDIENNLNLELKKKYIKLVEEKFRMKSRILFEKINKHTLFILNKKDLEIFKIIKETHDHIILSLVDNTLKYKIEVSILKYNPKI